MGKFSQKDISFLRSSNSHKASQWTEKEEEELQELYRKYKEVEGRYLIARRGRWKKNQLISSARSKLTLGPSVL